MLPRGCASNLTHKASKMIEDMSLANAVSVVPVVPVDAKVYPKKSGVMDSLRKGTLSLSLADKFDQH